MDEIYHIKYVDAYYSYAKKLGRVGLATHDAHGYVKKNGRNIVVAFIKSKKARGKEEVALGLVVPDTALIPKKNTTKNKILEKFKVGMLLAVTWRDIVIFDYTDSRNECSIMYTEGILFKTKDNLIVLKDPETIRMSPVPVRITP